MLTERCWKLSVRPRRPTRIFDHSVHVVGRLWRSS